MRLDVETIAVPAKLIDVIERRTRGIVRASFHDANILRSIALSCYLQGFEDALSRDDVNGIASD